MCSSVAECNLRSTRWARKQAYNEVRGPGWVVVCVTEDGLWQRRAGRVYGGCRRGRWCPKEVVQCKCYRKPMVEAGTSTSVVDASWVHTAADSLNHHLSIRPISIMAMPPRINSKETSRCKTSSSDHCDLYMQILAPELHGRSLHAQQTAAVSVLSMGAFATCSVHKNS